MMSKIRGKEAKDFKGKSGVSKQTWGFSIKNLLKPKWKNFIKVN
jgi:hypothetical protein